MVSLRLFLASAVSFETFCRKMDHNGRSDGLQDTFFRETSSSPG